MQENSLYKAIYNLDSIKELPKQLGIQHEHRYVWIKNVSKTLVKLESIAIKEKIFYRLMQHSAQV